MKYKGHKATLRAILKFLVVRIVLAKATSPLCPKGTYKSSFTDDCSICPPDSKNNCKGEGADTGSCEQACIEDINECLTRPCHPNANCTDTEGSHDCKCNFGFSGNGVNCTNIDECLSKPCHVNASCTDSEGSYGCQCNPGFSGNGFSKCTNIDECLIVLCHVNADCLDTPGSYICRCKTGFNGNGTFCENDSSDQSGMNLALAIGIPMITLIPLLLLLACYCHRTNKRCRAARFPREHEESVEMETMRGPNENQLLSQPPPAADELQYNGAGTALDLNKDNQGSSLLIDCQ